MKFKIYSIVFTLTIFVLVQMTILEIPNIFENVLAQQQDSSSQQRSNDDQLRDRDLDDRRHEIEQRSSQGESSQESEDANRDFDRRQNIE
jgi:hypothetical protein